MTTLSPLARGYGSWTGPSYDPYHEKVDEGHFPHIHLEPDSHRHGVTVGPFSRSATSMSFKSTVPAPNSARMEKGAMLKHDTDQQGKLNLPKTYLTRKGALILFSAPENDEEEVKSKEQSRIDRGGRVKKLIDASLKLGTIDRLALSILEYGDEEYDKENSSITDEKNKMFMKFLHKTEDESDVDSRSRPGSDLRSYLRDLKYRSSFRAGMSGSTYIPRSRETMELQAILRGLQNDTWPLVYNADGGLERSSTYSEFTRPASQQSARTPAPASSRSSTPRSILSTKKLRESLKSYGSYLGRPKSAPDVEGRHPVRVVVRRHQVGDSSDTVTSSPRQRKKMVTSSMTGSIMEEEEAAYDEINIDAMTGTEGSIAFTDSTELDKHLYTFDLPSGDRNFTLSHSYYGDGVNSVGFHGDGITFDRKASDNKKVGKMHENLEVEGSDGEDVEVLYVANGDQDRHGNKAKKELLVMGSNENRTVENVVTAQEKISSDKEQKYVDKSVTTAESVRSDTVNDQMSSMSRLDNIDVETSTTISEEMLDPHGINRIDIKTHFTGTAILEEEQGMGVEIAYKGENQLSDLAENSGFPDALDASLAMENDADWAKQAEAASVREAEEIQATGDDMSHGGLYLHDVDMPQASQQADMANGSPTQSQALHDHSGTSPVDKKSSHTTTPTQRPPSVKSSRRQSVLSARSRTTPTPPSSARAVKTPTPIGMVKAEETTSPPLKKSPSPTSRRQEVGSRPSSQHSRRSQTPDSVVGKVTSMEVVITRKSSADPGQMQEIRDQLVHGLPSDTTPRTSTSKISKTPSPSPKQQHVNPKSPVLGKTDCKDIKPTSPVQPPKPTTTPELPGSKSPAHADTSQHSPTALDQHREVVDSAKVTDGMPVVESGAPVVEGGIPAVEGGGEDDEAASVASSLLQEQDIVLPKEDDEDEVEEVADITQKDEQEQSGSNRVVPVPEKQEKQEGNKLRVDTPDVTPASKGTLPTKAVLDGEKKVEETKTEEEAKEEETKKEDETTKEKKEELPTIPDYLKPKPPKPIKGRPQKTKRGAGKAKKDPTKAISVASVQPKEEQKVADQSYTLYENKRIPKEKEKSIIPDYVSEALSNREAESKEELERQMKQMASTVNETITVPDLSESGEGLTEEEMELAKKILQERVAAATEKMEEMENPPEEQLVATEPEPEKVKEVKVKAVKIKEGKVKGKSKKAAKPSSEVSEKDAIKQKKEQELKKKEEEKKLMEEKIKEKHEKMEDHDRMARNRELEIQLEIERLKQQEDEIQQADDDVREYLSESRKKQLEEMRERKRANLERKKQLAKEKFDAEKKKRQEESKKALAELDRIHDEEIWKQKRLEEEMRREEEERLALEKMEEEEKERIKAEEDHERRMMEILQEEEEKAMQRLADERDAAARQRRELEEERHRILEEEEKKRQAILEEQRLLEEAIRKKEEEEERKREQERMRYRELKRLEEEARLQMQMELEARREAALERRRVNLERKDHMGKLKQNQGVTRAWVFSYFVRWPLETYNIPFGGYPDPKNQRFRSKAKSPTRPKTAGP